MAIVASAAISSGDLVQVGDVFAVALTDIPQGETGDGITEGVFMLPKLKTDDMKTGKKVYLKSGKVQLTNSGSDPLVGVVWADAGTSAEVNRPGFPGECFICELRLPDHRFRWKHNKLFLLLPEEYGPAFPAIVDCYTSPPT
ncbi:hypothetical protein VEE21_05570 [Escherichia coli]|nr:hypothetical protein VEE21_05570 [Escherichia coli]